MPSPSGNEDPSEVPPTENRNGDLTKGDPIRTSTIEELKSKLGAKETDETEAMIPETQRSHGQQQPHLNEDGLIVPKKLINPVLDSKEMQKLQKELLFNQKLGKKLNQKSELVMAMEKVKDNKAKKELEKINAAKKPELEKVIADRARRMENNSPIQNEDDRSLNKDLLQVKAKLKATTDCK
ncbi:PREDICTED: protein FAM107B isoform X2 [Nicrophorus vespilloides]|uniref:Protein FAM107B isoform X2 n=1 Tax=Nicrophorus vespilloides TaxID=110193 RepID=A0ABM1NIR3_NICVS|nr:PREDICTED: protein FAM107B isoform X2 [Nicrophorus vespilloides]